MYIFYLVWSMPLFQKKKGHEKSVQSSPVTLLLSPIHSTNALNASALCGLAVPAVCSSLCLLRFLSCPSFFPPQPSPSLPPACPQSRLKKN